MSRARQTAISRGHLLVPLAIALFVVMLAQIVRVLFPRVLILGEDTSYLVVGLLAVMTFASPLVALPLARWVAVERVTLAGGLAIVVARVALQLVHPIPAWLAFAAPSIAFVGACLLLVGHRASGRHDGRLAAAVVLGLALDTAIRAPSHTWDLIWQDGAAAILTTAALVGVAVAALWVVVTRLGRAADAGPPGGGILAALGPYLMLQLVFLQNPGYVGSQSGIGFPGAVLVVLAADVVAIVAAVVATRQPGVVPTIIAAGLAGVLGWLATSAHGFGAVVLVAVLQASVTFCLARALTSGGHSRPAEARTVVGATAAGLSFAILVLLWMIDIDLPLPFPREAVPAAAAALVGLAAIVRTRSLQPAEEPTAGMTARAIVVTMLGIAILVPGFLWITRSATDLEPIPGPEVRVVDYNIRGAVGVDGMLRPDDIVREIASGDPDVVILQEVARGWPVMGAGDVLAYIQAALEMPYVYQPAADKQFGNAILSRLPLERIGAEMLPDVPGEQRRSYLAVRVHVGEGRLVIIGTHITPDSIEQIAALLDAWGGTTPAVIAGDMNMQPDDEASVARFRDAGLVDAEGAAGDECRTTSSEPLSDCDRPDWIWVTTDLDITSFRIGAIDASDHLPIHITVALPA